VLLIRSTCFGSSIQKRLPLLASDSTPLIPPNRSMAFETMARPTPVEIRRYAASALQKHDGELSFQKRSGLAAKGCGDEILIER
jgi:hypothetical protein